jgi:hypothetical protein
MGGARGVCDAGRAGARACVQSAPQVAASLGLLHATRRGEETEAHLGNLQPQRPVPAAESQADGNAIVATRHKAAADGS